MYVRGQTSIEYIILVGIAVILILAVTSALNTFYTIVLNATNFITAIRQDLAVPIPVR